MEPDSPHHSALVTPPPPLPPPAQPPGQTSGYAVTSLVLGVLSIVPGVYVGGLVIGRYISVLRG